MKELLTHKRFRVRAGMEFMSTAEMGDDHILVLQDESNGQPIRVMDILSKKEFVLSTNTLKENFIYTGCAANIHYLTLCLAHEGVEVSNTDKLYLMSKLLEVWSSQDQ